MKQIILAGGRDKWRRVTIRPIELRGKTMWQMAYWDGQKEVHKNVDDRDKVAEVQRLRALGYRVTGENSVETLGHDHVKRWMLPVDRPVDFLIKLGVQSKNGKIISGKYDKFVQINEYLRHLDEIAKTLLAKTQINIVDFGCGNAYLTLATYWYFTEHKSQSTMMTGVDKREDIIANCKLLIENLGWTDIDFRCSSIKDFNDEEHVDIVMSLHACDTATDDALAWGEKHNAQIIVAAPCCQQYVQTQMKWPKEPLFKQRLGDVATDQLRVAWLRARGYSTDAIEFVPTTHTPKNIMIRSVANKKVDKLKAQNDYIKLKEFWGVIPYLEKV